MQCSKFRRFLVDRFSKSKRVHVRGGRLAIRLVRIPVCLALCLRFQGACLIPIPGRIPALPSHCNSEKSVVLGTMCQLSRAEEV
jgi:hypothetical protein